MEPDQPAPPGLCLHRSLATSPAVKSMRLAACFKPSSLSWPGWDVVSFDTKSSFYSCPLRGPPRAKLVSATAGQIWGRSGEEFPGSVAKQWDEFLSKEVVFPLRRSESLSKSPLCYPTTCALPPSPPPTPICIRQKHKELCILFSFPYTREGCEPSGHN